MKAEKKERKPEKNRDNYYVSITLSLSQAQQNLADYSFLTLITSVRTYIDALEKMTLGKD